MKNLIISFLIAHFSFLILQEGMAQIIHIPADYPTIQQGIDAVNTGDTVLVSPGTYVENINFNGKNLTVASLFLTSQDPSYIGQTIIDGNQAGSAVTIWSGEDTTALLSGFTIINSYGSWGGGGISLSNTSPRLENLIIRNNLLSGIGLLSSSPYIRNVMIRDNQSSGVCCIFSDPHLLNVTITGNQSYYGGGIYLSYSNPVMDNITIAGNSANYGGGMYAYSSNPIMRHVDLRNNLATNEGGGIYFESSQPFFDAQDRCNIYLNDAETGADLYNSNWYGGVIDIVTDTFSVMYPTEYYAYPIQYFTFDILNAKIEQVMADLYVSPTGDDANSGLTADDPLKTIHYALLKIYADSLNPRIVHLLEGTYSPSANGESFPLRIPEYIHVDGVSESSVIVNAEFVSGVFEITQKQHVTLSNLTVTGGSGYGGGGIYCEGSTPVFQNLNILNNQAEYGGGMYLGSSDPVLQSVDIKNNSANSWGGGIYFAWSQPDFDSIYRCNIHSNTCGSGADLYAGSAETAIEVILDTFTVLIPRSFHAFPLESFTFNIRHGLIPQENVTLYLSPAGSDTNTGLTPEDPLKTIQHAISLVNESPLDFYTMQLHDGTYSPSATGETFPLSIPESVKLQGESENGAILDAEGTSNVISIYAPGVEISELTIQGGYYSAGGGIYCYSVSPLLQHLTIKNNTSEWAGGGLYLANCLHPVLTNVTITGNYSQSDGGGMMIGYNTRPRLQGVTITGNTAENGGGGIVFSYSAMADFDSVERCNIYLNNAGFGKDLYSNWDNYNIIDVVLDTFTVLYPITDYAAPLNHFRFDILHGVLPQENVQLYVSPEGDDANSGLTEDDPVKTIQHALTLAAEDPPNIHTVNLANGIYSPSATGETFPLDIPDNLSVVGESENGVIVDAEGTWTVITINSSYNASLSNLTVTGGYKPDSYWTEGRGGGIYCSSSNAYLQDLTITGNWAQYGGGIYFEYSYPTSSTKLKNVTITGNSAGWGGGVCFGYSNFSGAEFDTTDRCNIYLNQATTGNDLVTYAENMTEVILDTFTVLNPTAFHAWPLYKFTFDILNGKLAQANADLYVSPGGDNANSGLTEDDPLKTIHFAYLKMLADSLNQHAVRLLPGTYGPSSNGEIFPLRTFDYIHISGQSPEDVILDAEGQSAVITIENYQPTEISGLTVTGGSGENGGGIYCGYGSRPNLLNINVSGNTSSWGGGMFLNYNASPHLQNVRITGNMASGGGGGMYFYYANPVFDSTDRCDIFLNQAVSGNDLYNSVGWGGNMVKVVVDTFTVLYPNEYHVYPIGSFSFDILHGKLEQIDGDLFVSPDGDDTNSGISAAEPLKTIRMAISKIALGEDHPNAIRLLEGTYSPSATGELFPLRPIEYFRLEGVSPQDVILDAEGLSRVFEITDLQNVSISGITITGGNSNIGGGMYVYNSSPQLQDVNITLNHSTGDGGGIHVVQSNPLLLDVSVTGNSSDYSGGGIFCGSSNGSLFQNVCITNNYSGGDGGGIYFGYAAGENILKNVTISYNSAYTGGGLYSGYSGLVVFDSTERCNIYLNEAFNGMDLCSYQHMDVIVDTFTVLYPKPFHASPLENFTFDILHGKVAMINADVFVSPDGDNGNIGQTAEEPLKNIWHAINIIAEDSQHPNTIRLLNGRYSSSGSGELFPVVIPQYISLAGESEAGVILDAEKQSRVVEFIDNQVTGLSNLTITGGYTAESGGGIYCKNSGLTIRNVTVSNNAASKGAGIFLDYSSPEIQNVTVSNNLASASGGGIYCFNSSPVLQDVVLENDSSSSNGGGIACANGSVPVLKRVSFFNNYAGNSGGGFFCTNGPGIVIDSAVFNGNIAKLQGGGIYLYNSDAVLDHITATANSSSKRGGAVYSISGYFDLRNTAIQNNSSQTGGGVYCANGSASYLNSLFADNVSDAGAGIYHANSDMKAVNVSLAHNMAQEGGAIYCYNSELEIWNSILWSDADHELYYRHELNPSSAVFYHSDIKGGESGIVTNNNGTYTFMEGMIDADPLFNGAGDHPYSLSATSPCRNAGTPDTTGLFLPWHDLSGGPRVWEGRVDMGAYEWSNVGVEESAVGSQQSAVSIWPNPTGGSLQFAVRSSQEGHVTLKLYNAQGQEVATVLDKKLPAGEHTVRWDAGRLPAGVYNCRLSIVDCQFSTWCKLVKY